MIQESINQLITTAGIASRLAPGYEKRQEAKNILGEAKAAKAGLQATEKGLMEENKILSETELSDIGARTGSLNRALYTAKIGATEGHPLEKYLKKGVKDLPKQTEISPTLRNIEQQLDIRKKALDRSRNLITGAVDQDKYFKEYKNLIMGGNNGTK